MPFGLKDLGANIIKIRKSRPSRIKPGKPMLQRELAELSNIPASSLCNIENGKYNNPTWEILSKIADGLDCDISYFFVEPERHVSPYQLALNEMIEMIIRERLASILEESRTK
ncbi:MAG: helix-turn-helix transcriptional regulator [Candidatus Aminicenantes bacterium]|nr:helix-turn-helix transcriptional regulator [Candidatus Aminicenantes bacterium]